MITDAFKRAFELMIIRNWEHIYVAVDIHGTILPGHYKNKQDLIFYPYAEQVLNQLTKSTSIKLILYSCTAPEEIQHYLSWFEKHDIHFDFINENPECVNTHIADFNKKPYFSVLLDDKAGFNPEDWKTIFDFLSKRIFETTAVENNDDFIECIICGKNANEPHVVIRTSCHKYVCDFCCGLGFQINPMH
jgi:hypothetical protein